MAPSATHGNGSQLVLVGESGGVTLIDQATPLRRLHYFDGKFLRASDFDVEQRYLRQLVALSNQGLGPGVVYGYDTTLGTGDTIQVGPGLAIDPSGKVLLLQATATHSIQALIEASRTSSPVTPDASGKIGSSAFNDCVEVAAPRPPATAVPAVSDIYVIAICAAEAFCGQQDVYGKLCEEACVTTKDRQYRLDSLVLRAIPLQLMTPFPTSKAVSIDSSLYLRSKVAHSWYADEVAKHPHSISRAGLLSHIWCVGAGYRSACCEVPLAVVARAGSSTVFLDAWIVRRERMDAPARRYWQWTMMMRPWDVYLSHVLQFQCQLADVLSGVVPPGGRDGNPCAPQQEALSEAVKLVEQVREGLVSYRSVAAGTTASSRPPLLSLSLSQVSNLHGKMQAILTSGATPARPTDRVLIRGGVISAPSAAYLPVMTGTSVTVNAQVRALLGDGLDLRFCVVRPDFVAHAFEEAQHMERISLLQGLDNPNDKPKVDVLVPDGRVAAEVEDRGRYYEMRLNVLTHNLALIGAASTTYGTGAFSRAANADASAANALRGAYLAGLARGGESGLETFEYNGAARTERTPAGAMSFYYAGTTGNFILGRDRSQADAPAPAPAPALGPIASDTVGAAPPASSTSGASGGFAETATSINPSMLAGRVLGTNLFSTAAPEARSSLWSSFTMGRDPIDLERGEATTVSAETIVLLTLEARVSDGTTNLPQATETILLRAGFTGELQVEDTAAQPGSSELHEVHAVIAGELTLTYKLGSQQKTVSVYLSENVRVRRTAGQTGHAFRIRVQQPSLLQPLVAAFEVRREWKSATQAEVLGTMSLVVPAEQTLATNTLVMQPAAATKTLTREAFHAWQTINPHVRQPDHPAHESAIRALRTIGSAMTGTKFADLAAKRLFPPSKPAGAELTLHATLDWVLFHRRRDKTCHREIPVAPLQTRQYALYHVKLADNQSVADLAKLLQRTGPQRKGLPTLDFVQIVEFAAGIHAVASPHRQVQASWQQDVGTGTGPIAGGIIASHGVAAAEGTSLAQARLESLVDVIRIVGPVDSHPDYTVLTRVPDALDVPSNDGIIVVATKQAVATKCHDVYGVATSEELNALVQAAQAGNLPQTLAASKGAVPLGKVAFSGTTPDAAQLQAVVQKWNQAKWDEQPFGAASTAAVVALATDPAGPTYVPQTTAIMTALGKTITPVFVTTTGTMPGCPAITIVAGSIVVRNALLVYGTKNGPDHFLRPGAPSSPMEFRDNVPQGNALANFINSLTANQPVGEITLATPNGPPDAGAAARAQAVSDALVAAGRPAIPTSQRTIQPLSTHDRAQLQFSGHQPAGFDDVIFFTP